MAPVPAAGEEGGSAKKPDKSYFASAVESINPWSSSRSTTPTPKEKDTSAMPPPPKPGLPRTKRADDHSVNTIYGQSFRRYPPDCPPMEVKWFYAVDVPKRKPKFLKGKKEKEEPKPSPPKKFAVFTAHDSRSIENAYQRLLEELEDEQDQTGSTIKRTRSRSRHRGLSDSVENAANTSIDGGHEAQHHGVRVPVNEDFLFDVDIEERELAPVYWLGPVYEVRRGTWFYQEGSSLRPCEENLAAQLEEGYLKTKPWTYPSPTSGNKSGAPTPKASRDNLKDAASSQEAENPAKPPPSPAQHHQPQTYRLFGAYMNSIATYQDANTAWLTSDSMFSWVTSTVYQRFAGGAYMSGVKLVRGYSEPGKKDDKRPATPQIAQSSSAQASDKEQKSSKRRSAPPQARRESLSSAQEDEQASAELDSHENRLKRQFSSYMETAEDPDKQQESIRKREEQEIQDDYNAQIGETQGREIEHLILVTHGIGQLLGLRMESVNFIHDVNMLRKTLKGVYNHSDDLRALNAETGSGPGNCRVQVLPVCWRHLLDFPRRREKKGERDLTSASAFDEEDEYPSLDDITIEGVAFARSLISDLALDVLLYQSSYREQIADIVLRESNRIYKLFMERNPEFKGKVHIMGHSLGSAIMFDILCRQKEGSKRNSQVQRNPLRFWPTTPQPEPPKDPRALTFDFDTEDFYCLGSPVGLFQMLKGRTVAARHLPSPASEESQLNVDIDDDPFSVTESSERLSTITGLPFSVSSPKVAQLFNIFHPSDPVAYRIEPLISPAMKSLKPQVLPYTKRGILNAVAPQGLSGIGVKVGQSVGNLWNSISGGIASSLLNRSLGLSNEDVATLQASNSGPQDTTPGAALSPAAGTNIIAGGVISDTTLQSEKSVARQKALARQNSSNLSSNKQGNGDNNATLIDDDLETLYSKFMKKRVEEHKAAASRASEGVQLGDEWAKQEVKAQKMRKEELKVRGLNRNGRVDYSIQESVLDFNPINTIASHMSYWQDEDVSHFILSQLLANKSQSKHTDS